MKKKILLDMSATILHHGHIRLIKKASKYGKVVIGLTKDAQIKKFKGYTPKSVLNIEKKNIRKY